MDTNNAIEVRDLKKKFKIYHDKGKMLKERVINIERNKYEEHWVLNGISFDIKKGEAVGLIGQNGCGKSTTLKLLTKIMYPTSGSVQIQGRVSSLLELGAGFHPDLSGRENIYINASIFGLTKKEIDKRIADIIEFSELEEYIDNPVRTYSSGMYMRLAFSVAINVDADVLLVDEILAVGDISFQNKCLNKMLSIKESGTTIVLVSHSASQIESICDRSIWIHNGLIRMQGAPIVVHEKYFDFMCKTKSATLNTDISSSPQTLVTENAPSTVSSEKIWLTDKHDRRRHTFSVGESLNLQMQFEFNDNLPNIIINATLIRDDGVVCSSGSSQTDDVDITLTSNHLMATLIFECPNLLNGNYYFAICILDNYNRTIGSWDHVAEFSIESAMPDTGLVYLDHNWHIN